MDETLILVTFGDDSHAYQALSELKTLDAQARVSLQEAGVVHRDASGLLSIADEDEPHSDAGSVTGTFVGLLVGTLAGPLGVLLGGAVGLLGGSLYDLDEDEDADSVLERIARNIPNSSTALVAAIGEYGFAEVDTAMQGLGGTVSRYSRHDVEAEIAAADKAARKAKRQARKTLRRSRRTAAQEKVHAKLEQMRAKLHTGRQKLAQH